MIQAKTLNCFDKFVKRAISLDIPFHIIAYHKDISPLQNFYGENKPSKKFTIRLVLCCSIFTIFLDSSLPVEEKEKFEQTLNDYNAEEFDKISIKDGIVTCE